MLNSSHDRERRTGIIRKIMREREKDDDREKTLVELKLQLIKIKTSQET